MNFEKLERNMLSVMEEQQLKLGFDGNALRLFYPLSSLNALLGTSLDENQMAGALVEYAAYVRERLGVIEADSSEGRFSFLISPEGCAYVREHLNKDAFIARFIRLISRHGCTIDRLLLLFREYSQHVHFERMPDGSEFDYLVYFEDGKPDAFCYCLKEDMGHMTYHRFTREDYHEFGF